MAISGGVLLPIAKPTTVGAAANSAVEARTVEAIIALAEILKAAEVELLLGLQVDLGGGGVDQRVVATHADEHLLAVGADVEAVGVVLSWKLVNQRLSPCILRSLFKIRTFPGRILRRWLLQQYFQTCCC